MKESIMFLKVAQAEIQTIIEYQGMLDQSEQKQQAKPILDEIMGDEFNHALIALLTAARIMDIDIPADGIKDAGDEPELENIEEKTEEA